MENESLKSIISKMKETALDSVEEKAIVEDVGEDSEDGELSPWMKNIIQGRG